MTTAIEPARGVRPRQPAPDLTVPLLGGGTFRLVDRRPERFTDLSAMALRIFEQWARGQVS